jgi:hypothetical protein
MPSRASFGPSPASAPSSLADTSPSPALWQEASGQFLSAQPLGAPSLVLEPQVGFTSAHGTVAHQIEDVVALSQVGGDIGQRRLPLSRQFRAGDVAKPRPGALQLGGNVNGRQPVVGEVGGIGDYDKGAQLGSGPERHGYTLVAAKEAGEQQVLIG